MADQAAVSVETAGSLKHYVAPGTVLYNVRTVGEAVTRLALPEKSGQLTMLVKGRPAYWNTELEDGDTLKLVPAITGE